MQITKNEISPGSAQLQLKLEVNDYKDKYLSELRKQAQKAQMKGFRKGKTPSNIIRKMYGKSILFDVVMDRINDELNEYITKENLELLGQPIPAEDHPENDFDPIHLKDIDFVFDIGYAPDFEVNGLDKTFTLYKVQIEDDMVTEELDNLTSRSGKLEEVENDIQPDDRIKINAEEMEGNEVKENGWATEFSILISTVGDEDLKTQLLTLKKGDSFDFDIDKIEKDKDEKFVRKYLLNMDEGDETEVGNRFRGTITSVSRMIPAEVTVEWLQRMFNDEEVTTEEQAREKILANIQSFYDNQCKEVLFHDIKKALQELNPIELPNEFLKRFMKNEKEGNEVEVQDDEFTKSLNATRWQLIKAKLEKKMDIQVEPDEVVQSIRRKVLNYSANYSFSVDMVDDLTKRLLNDEKQVRDEYVLIAERKFLQAIFEIVDKNVEEITRDEYMKMVAALNENAKG